MDGRDVQLLEELVDVLKSTRVAEHQAYRRRRVLYLVSAIFLALCFGAIAFMWLMVTAGVAR